MNPLVFEKIVRAMFSDHAQILTSESRHHKNGQCFIFLGSLNTNTVVVFKKNFTYEGKKMVILTYLRIFRYGAIPN